MLLALLTLFIKTYKSTSRLLLDTFSCGQRIPGNSLVITWAAIGEKKSSSASKYVTRFWGCALLATQIFQKLVTRFIPPFRQFARSYVAFQFSLRDSFPSLNGRCVYSSLGPTNVNQNGFCFLFYQQDSPATWVPYCRFNSKTVGFERHSRER